MMLYAWILQWVLIGENLDLEAPGRTLDYLFQVGRQLTPKQHLYAEMRWRQVFWERRWGNGR